MFRRLAPLLAALCVLLAASPAQAQETRRYGASMEPLIRLHLGASYVPGPSPVGLIGGMDSRFTRLLYMDFGGIISPFAIDTSEVEFGEKPADDLHMRHGLYITPGLRIPHRQPEKWAWDINFRGGIGIIWLAYTGPVLNAQSYDSLEFDPAGVGGLDLSVRTGNIGLRATGRAFFTLAYNEAERDDVFFWTPQFSLEALYEF